MALASHLGSRTRSGTYTAPTPELMTVAQAAIYFSLLLSTLTVLIAVWGLQPVSKNFLDQDLYRRVAIQQALGR